MTYKTPAARRFVPPSSSTSSSRPAFSKRFINPSQSQSAPYLRTPVSFKKAVPKDDIQEIDLENEEEAEYVDYAEVESSQKVPTSGFHEAIQDVVEDYELGYGSDEPDQHLDKRLKVRHSTVSSIQNSGTLSGAFSSSPSAPDSQLINAMTQQLTENAENASANPDDSDAGENEDDATASPSSSQESAPKEFETPRQHLGRFRNALAQPSIPAGSVALSSFQTRLQGKAAFKPKTKPQMLELDFILPHAFSPSRKKLEEYRDFVRGGNAETVGNWILGTAAKAVMSPKTSRRSLTSERYQENRTTTESYDRYQIIDILTHDTSNQFLVVEVAQILDMNDAEPGERSVWLLLDQDLNITSDNKSVIPSKFDNLVVGRTIRIKGGEALQWQLTFPSCSSGAAGSHCVCVASVWEFAA